MRHSLFFTPVLLLICCSSLWSQQPSPSAVQAVREFNQIEEEWTKVEQAFQKSVNAAKTAAEFRQLNDKLRGDLKPHAERMMKLFDTYPETYGGAAALYWIARHSITSDDAREALAKLKAGPVAKADIGLWWGVLFHQSGMRLGFAAEVMPLLVDRVKRELDHPKAPDLLIWVYQVMSWDRTSWGDRAYREAGDLLMSRFPEAKYVWRFCEFLERNPDQAWAERHLRTALEKNKVLAARVTASFALASIIQNKNEESQAEAQRLYEQVIAHAEEAAKEWNRQANDPKLRESTMAFQPKERWIPPARAELEEIKTRGIGKLAQDIVGEDLEGKPMKLSDYRGKVVLLDFWAFW